MDDEERRGTIRRLIEAQNAGDLSAFEAIYHDDLVVEWPQSGEVVHGKENLLALRQAFPTPPTASLRRITGSGDLWVIEMTFGYGEDIYHVAVIHEYRDGKVARETSYYGAPFEPPAWRGRWVDVVPPADRASGTSAGEAPKAVR